jgi:CheY-like chemotaxis protein
MLLVEDNAADVVFFKEALGATGIPARVEVVDNGEEAIRFLRHWEGRASAPRPDVIVLDLNTPIKSGREVIEDLADDPSLKLIPVAVLSTSIFETHLCDLYPPGQCRYFVKTDDFALLQDIVREIAAHARTTGGRG